MVAVVRAEAAIEKFGGDSIAEFVDSWKASRARTTERFKR